MGVFDSIDEVYGSTIALALVMAFVFSVLLCIFKHLWTLKSGAVLLPFIVIFSLIDMMVARVDHGYLVGFAEKGTADLKGMFWVTQLGQVQLGLTTCVMLETRDLIGILREQLAVVVGLACPFLRNGHTLRPSCSPHVANAAHAQSDAGGNGDCEGYMVRSVARGWPRGFDELESAC